MTINKLDELISVYSAHIENMADEEHADTESLLALLTRDSIEEVLDEATPMQQAEVQRLDHWLADMYRMVAKILPNPNFTDRRRWWWFLHEGPQVRAEAQLASRESGVKGTTLPHPIVREGPLTYEQARDLLLRRRPELAEQPERLECEARELVELDKHLHIEG